MTDEKGDIMMTLRISAMSIRIVLGGLACIGAGVVALTALPMCASEPPPPCHVAIGEAIAAYTPVGPPAGTGCANWVPPTLQGLGTGTGCGMTRCRAAMPATGDAGPTIVGEAFGLESYVPDPNDPNAPNIPGSMAIKLEYAGVRIQDYSTNYVPSIDGGADGALQNYPYPDTNPAPAPPPQTVSSNNPYAWGVFDTVQPVNGVCTVTMKSGSKMVYPDVPAHMAASAIGTQPPGIGMGMVPDQPQTTLDYEWSNVRVVADTGIGSVGGQIFADLMITQDACSQSFHVSMLAPRAQCNGQDDAGNAVADPTQCVANANSTQDNYPIVGNAGGQAQAYGSGIYPNVPVQCLSIYPPAISAHAKSEINDDFECLPTKTAP